MSQSLALRVPFAVDLYGAGQVGGALRAALAERGVPVAAVHRRSSIERSGIVAESSAIVDATPPALHGSAAEDWISFLEETLRAGTPIVTCNKAPLALAWNRLSRAAHAGGVALAATATVGGGTPFLPLLRRLNQLRPVAALEASLSGTLGLIVPRVKAGASLPDALREAQRLGFCEPDARLDLDGTDSWAKACILHNVLWPEREPISLRGRPTLELEERSICALRNPAVVARIASGHMELGLGEWDAASRCPGNLVRALLVDGAAVEIAGPGAGPASTAQALLSDLEALAAGRLSPGIGP